MILCGSVLSRDSLQFQKQPMFFSCSILGYSGHQSKGTSSETRTGKILMLHVLQCFTCPGQHLAHIEVKKCLHLCLKLLCCRIGVLMVFGVIITVHMP